MKDYMVANVEQTYSQVFVIVSPPRCSSTALSRVFWEHPLIRYYAHEPFEVLYYLNQGIDDVCDRIKNPLDIRALKRNPDNCTGNGIVIKEMPYQVGPHFELLANLATAPIIFLIRDPRLNILSRIKKKVEVGDTPLFPLSETGWELLESQITFCQVAAIPYLIVDSTDFRNHPHAVLKELFTRLHLSFSKELLLWQPQSTIDIDNLDGKHSHLYKKVLQSDSLIPDQDTIPSLDSFPVDEGFLQHITECLHIYKRLKETAQLVTQENGNDRHFVAV